MTRVCIIGSSGFIGKYLFMKLSETYRVFGISRNRSVWTNIMADISNKDEIHNALDKIKPDVVIHVAAYSHVEGCETNKDLAERTNITGTWNVASWCKQNKSKMIFISSDYVYDIGSDEKSETSRISPINFYSYTKIEGEKIVTSVPDSLIIRTGFVYGYDPGGKNFFMQVVESDEIVVPNDQYVNPTYVEFLSEFVYRAIKYNLKGVYNVNGPENISRYEFAKMIKEMLNLDVKIIPKKTKDMGYKAKRPLILKINSNKAYRDAGIMPLKNMDYIKKLSMLMREREIKVYKRNKCRGCGGKNVLKIFSYGNIPITNSFRKSYPDLSYVPLDIMFCNDCCLVQIWYVPEKEDLFLNYPYATGVSRKLVRHFTELAKKIKQRFNITESDTIVEIGSNDGTFQKIANSLGMRVIGVEPARNLAKMATDAGMTVINSFFDDDSVNKIISEYGKAKVIVASNVLAHIDDMESVIKNIKVLLDDDGTLVMEVHYIVDLVEKFEYDNMYHEHLNEYSLTAIVNMFSRFGMVVVDAERIPIHGGSIRVFVKKHGEPSDSVEELLLYEKDNGFLEAEKYVEFFKKAEKHSNMLFEKLNDLKLSGKRIFSYGASARGMVLLTFSKIGLNIIDKIVDKNPLKQYTLSPLSAVPIVKPQEIYDYSPDYIVLTAYTYLKEILKENKDYCGSWIVPIPEIQEKGVTDENKVSEKICPEEEA